VFLFAILLPAAALAQPNAFPVWERPAAGVFLGASGNGDANSRASGADVGFVFDTPVVFGYRVRADVSRVAWRFGARDVTGVLKLNDTVTLKSIRLGVARVWQLSPRMAGYAGGGYGAYRYEYATTPLHNPWRGGTHLVAGWEVVSQSQRYALDRLRNKLEYTTVGFQLLPEKFTLTELQEVYEAILGKKMDKRNFRRKLSLLKILKPLPEYRRGGQRPARLFRFVAARFEKLKDKGILFPF
jgi:ADP-ribose pyrophosphatase YjhB (NUDIX family)